jgi:hypothetical protein
MTRHPGNAKVHIAANPPVRALWSRAWQARYADTWRVEMTGRETLYYPRVAKAPIKVPARFEKGR